MEYINEGFTLPIPLNLLPTPVSIFYGIKACCKKVEKTNKPEGDINYGDEPSININSQMQPPNGNLPSPISKYENNNSKVMLITNNAISGKKNLNLFE